jgi:hypothetical protein
VGGRGHHHHVPQSGGLLRVAQQCPHTSHLVDSSSLPYLLACSSVVSNTKRCACVCTGWMCLCACEWKGEGQVPDVAVAAVARVFFWLRYKGALPPCPSAPRHLRPLMVIEPLALGSRWTHSRSSPCPIFLPCRGATRTAERERVCGSDPLWPLSHTSARRHRPLTAHRGRSRDHMPLAFGCLTPHMLALACAARNTKSVLRAPLVSRVSMCGALIFRVFYR